MKTAIASFKSIKALSEPKRIALFKEALDSGRASFITMGKVSFSLGDAPQAASTLRAAGISAGSISNAAYGAKAFRLAMAAATPLKAHNGTKVVDFDEAFFDTLSFEQCVTIAKVSDPSCHSSYHIRDPKIFNKIMSGKNWHEVLDFYSANGTTPTEAQASERSRKKNAEKAQKEHAAAMKKLAKAGARASYTAPAVGAKASASTKGGKNTGAKVIPIKGHETAAAEEIGVSVPDVMHKLDTVEAMLNQLPESEDSTPIVTRLRSMADQLEEQKLHVVKGGKKASSKAKSAKGKKVGVAA